MINFYRNNVFSFDSTLIYEAASTSDAFSVDIVVDALFNSIETRAPLLYYHFEL